MEDWMNTELKCEIWRDLYDDGRIGKAPGEDETYNLEMLYQKFKSRLLQELSEAGLLKENKDEN